MPDTRRGETPARLIERCDASITALQLVRADIDLLWRIGQHEATDPYPTSVRAKEAPTGKNPLTSTEAAALRGWPGDTDKDDRPDSDRSGPPHDPIGHLIEDIFWALPQIDRLTQGIEGRRQLIHRAAAKHFGRQDTTGTCDACDRTVPGTPQDRLRAGFCMADYQAWRRYLETTAEPSREQFIRSRQNQQRAS